MAYLLRFSLVDNCYYFRIGDGGDPEEFDRAVQVIKQWIPLNERRWNSEKGFWEVKATQQNEKKLVAIFENGRRCINKAKGQDHQLRLF